MLISISGIWCLRIVRFAKKGAEQCPVNGCGQQIRREEKEGHLKDKMQRHFDLVVREKERILWNTQLVSRENFQP